MSGVLRFGPVGLVIYNLLYWPYLLLSCAVLFVPALLIFLLTLGRRPRRLLHAYTTRWGGHYLTWAPGADALVEGRQRALGAGPAVFVANHQSMVDILAIYAVDLPFLWVSKLENFYAPFLGWNMWLNGYVPLRRGHLPSIRRMLRRCEAELRRGESLCVFPEGTRSLDGQLRDFYRGAFWVAVRNGVPIVPIVIDGTGEILAKGRVGIRPRLVRLTILDPIFPEQAGNDDRKLRDLTRERMRVELERLRGARSSPL